MFTINFIIIITYSGRRGRVLGVRKDEVDEQQQRTQRQPTVVATDSKSNLNLVESGFS